jgi:D-serine deaminase-like pyridoxal phosphate-dependent protein
MVKAGASDVLLANEIVTADAIERMAILGRHAKVSVAVDGHHSVAGLSAAAQHFGVCLDILVDVDTGLARCGVANKDLACDLAIKVSQAPGLCFAGLMGYEGRFRATTPDRDTRITRAFTILADFKAAIESAGLSVGVVSGGGTSTMKEALRDAAITEIQAGTYALMEPDLEGLGLPFRCAVSIAATVISCSPRRVVLDAGRRTIGCDYGLPLSLDPRGEVRAIGDEHLIMEWEGDLPELGSEIRVRPTQNRTTFNLHEECWLVDDEIPPRRIPIQGRRGVR